MNDRFHDEFLFVSEEQLHRATAAEMQGAEAVPSDLASASELGCYAACTFTPARAEGGGAGRTSSAFARFNTAGYWLGNILICPTIASMPSGRRQTKDLKCGYPECTSNVLFNRKYELQRHMEGHGPAVYWCPVSGCDKENFARPDKLKYHFEKCEASHRTSPLLVCVVPHCNLIFNDKGAFVAHLVAHGRIEGMFGKHVAALV
ncbi:hypothetical protein MBLNU230_g2629t1 [Neophaeotheca triangularis]